MRLVGAKLQLFEGGSRVLVIQLKETACRPPQRA